MKVNTWEECCKLDPRISDLLLHAKKRTKEEKEKFEKKEIDCLCENDLFYREFKPIICKLAGYERADGSPLATSNVYEIVIKKILNEMPNCTKNCGCM